jgi:hypothetical protein
VRLRQRSGADEPATSAVLGHTGCLAGRHELCQPDEVQSDVDVLEQHGEGPRGSRGRRRGAPRALTARGGGCVRDFKLPSVRSS